MLSVLSAAYQPLMGLTQVVLRTMCYMPLMVKIFCGAQNTMYISIIPVCENHVYLCVANYAICVLIIPILLLAIFGSNQIYLCLIEHRYLPLLTNYLTMAVYLWLFYNQYLYGGLICYASLSKLKLLLLIIVVLDVRSTTWTISGLYHLSLK